MNLGSPKHLPTNICYTTAQYRKDWEDSTNSLVQACEQIMSLMNKDEGKGTCPEGIWGSGCTAILILNTATEEVSGYFMYWLLPTPSKEPQYPLTRRQSGPQSQC